MKTVVIIPARLGSTRLPGKVLLPICDKPMVQHVYEAAKKASGISEVYIATDSDVVEHACSLFTSNIVMTDRRHESGTDRLAEAVGSIECDAVINLQADEPLIDPAIITQLAEVIKDPDITMVSTMHRLRSTAQLQSPNTVKVTVDRRSNALYFSRSIIPHHRDDWKILLDRHRSIPEALVFFKHIGIYGYKKDFLQRYSRMDQSYLEKVEKLEQLRVLENGFDIRMIETDYEPVGVDVQEDLDKVRALISCNEKKRKKYVNSSRASV